MVVRLGAAFCVAAIPSCSSWSITQGGIQKHDTLEAAANGPTIIGAATTYNSYRAGYWSGGTVNQPLPRLAQTKRTCVECRRSALWQGLPICICSCSERR